MALVEIINLCSDSPPRRSAPSAAPKPASTANAAYTLKRTIDTVNLNRLRSLLWLIYRKAPEEIQLRLAKQLQVSDAVWNHGLQTVDDLTRIPAYMLSRDLEAIRKPDGRARPEGEAAVQAHTEAGPSRPRHAGSEAVFCVKSEQETSGVKTEPSYSSRPALTTLRQASVGREITSVKTEDVFPKVKSEPSSSSKPTLTTLHQAQTGPPKVEPGLEEPNIRPEDCPKVLGITPETPIWLQNMPLFMDHRFPGHSFMCQMRYSTIDRHLPGRNSAAADDPYGGANFAYLPSAYCADCDGSLILPTRDGAIELLRQHVESQEHKTNKTRRLETQQGKPQQYKKEIGTEKATNVSKRIPDALNKAIQVKWERVGYPTCSGCGQKWLDGSTSCWNAACHLYIDKFDEASSRKRRRIDAV